MFRLQKLHCPSPTPHRSDRVHVTSQTAAIVNYIMIDLKSQADMHPKTNEYFDRTPTRSPDNSRNMLDSNLSRHISCVHSLGHVP